MFNLFQKPPFCEDCKWQRQFKDAYVCANPEVNRSHVVRVINPAKCVTCGVARDGDNYGRCAERGKYFEAKE